MAQQKRFTKECGNKAVWPVGRSRREIAEGLGNGLSTLAR
jgi:hypothetical protein